LPSKQSDTFLEHTSTEAISERETEMRNQGLYNYYEMNSYCKSEGVDTAYFMVQVENFKVKQKRNRLMMLVAMLTKLIRS
jgi:hypothetical protein